MKVIRPQNLKIFFGGGLLLFIVAFFCGSLVRSGPLASLSFFLAGTPIYLTNLTGTPADWICPYLEGNMCRGLGLDGGPLEWLELLTILILGIFWCGLLVVAGRFLIQQVISISNFLLNRDHD